jgi:ribonuclease J
MASIVTGDGELKYDSLSVIPLGGQSELGRMLWVVCYAGEMLLIDAGASYPSQDLPGVDLLLPSTNFLEVNSQRVQALLLTNGHEEHIGAIPYLLRHLDIPRIMAPRFVSAFLSQSNEIAHQLTGQKASVIDTIEDRKAYEIGPFNVEWIPVNDAIADACALRIGTPEGNIVYTSSFKLDQTPVDERLIDIGRLAEIGEEGVLLLISASAGVERDGYTPSERSVEERLEKHIRATSGRAFVVMPGTNTHRLQILFDIARRTNRKVLLLGEVLIRAAVAAAITGNLTYDRNSEAHLADLDKLPDQDILVVATGVEGDPMNMIAELASGTQREIATKPGDLVIFSAEVVPGRARQMANILDLFLAQGVTAVYGERERVHVPKHASREELKLMLSLTNPSYFAPTFGEGRHIMHHAQLAIDWGLPRDAIFPLQNGDILSISNGLASVVGAVESQAVFVNRDQGERVTTFSVNERRVLSMEGVVTISLLVDENGEMISGPTIDAGASGFLSSLEWQETKKDLRENLLTAHQKFYQSRTTDGASFDPGQLRSTLRETALKTLRSRLKAKPTLQVMVQQIRS